MALLVIGCNRPLPLGDGDGGASDLSAGVRDLAAVCRSNDDCSSPLQYECLAPTEFAGCGEVVNGVMCNSDSDCAGDAGTSDSSSDYGGPVCDDPLFYFMCGGLSGKLCIGGCANDGDCVGGRVCDANKLWWGVCVTRACYDGYGSCVRRPI